MTAPRLASQIPDPKNPKNPDGLGRMYARTEGGTPEVPSITTIIDSMNPKMEWWRGMCAGKEAVRLAPLMSKRLSELSGSALEQKKDDMAQWIDETAVRDMNLAAKRGDLVHNYAEAFARARLGEDINLGDERAKAYEGLRELGVSDREAEAFLGWVPDIFEKLKIKPLVAEGTVWNKEVGYAGTNDLYCLMNGVPTLVDYKTKKKVKDPSSPWYSPSIRPTIALQLEAARRGEEYFDENSGLWLPWVGREAVEQVGIAIAPNGWEAVRVIQSEETWETFKALRRVWGWQMGDKLGENPHIEGHPLKPF